MGIINENFQKFINDFGVLIKKLSNTSKEQGIQIGDNTSKIAKQTIQINENTSKIVEQSVQIKNNSSKIIEQDSKINNIEYINKRQDTLLNGLFNEDSDKRLTAIREGNSVKLDNSVDGTIDVNSVVGDSLVNLANIGHEFSHTVTSYYKDATLCETSMLKLNTDYTFVIFKEYLDNHNLNYNNFELGFSNSLNLFQTNTPANDYIIFNDNKFEVAIQKVSFTDFLGHKYLSCRPCRRTSVPTVGEEGNYKVTVVILEGDYTNKPIPTQAFEGIQSSFEDKLVTQEMIDSGKEKTANLGKYRADVKVVGKNKLNPKIFDNINNSTANSAATGVYNKELGTLNVETTTSLSWSHCYVESPVKPNTRYILRAKSTNSDGLQEIAIRRTDDSQVPLIGNSTQDDPNIYRVFNSGESTTLRFKFYCTRSTSQVGSVTYKDIQLEEVLEGQSKPTSFVSYKEYIQSLYLNEPLHKSNQLGIHNGQLGYWKNREKYLFNGTEQCTTSVAQSTNDNMCFSLKGVTWLKDELMLDVICNKLSSGFNSWSTTNDKEGICVHTGQQVIIRIGRAKLSSQDSIGFKALLKKWYDEGNPLTIICKLAQPLFIPILDNTPKWVLESFDDCSVNFESNVPVQSSTLNYSSNVVSVIALDKPFRLIKEITLTEDVTSINITTDLNNSPFELSELYFIFNYKSNVVTGELWVQGCKTMLESTNGNIVYVCYIKNLGVHNIALIKGESNLGYTYGVIPNVFMFDGVSMKDLKLTNLRAITGSTLKVYGR